MLNSKISKAVRLAIAFGAASTAAFSASSFAAEEDVVDDVSDVFTVFLVAHAVTTKPKITTKIEFLKILLRFISAP